MQIVFRSARPEDFDYCAGLYFTEMEKTIRELNLSMAKQVDTFRRQWQVDQVRIITLDEADVGWLQSRIEGGALFIAQLFVDPAFQRQGIGSTVMNRLIGEAVASGQAMTLGVVKTNPALRLYRRLGFHVTHADERKFYMRRKTTTE